MARAKKREEEGTHPHLGSLDLPLVSIPLPASPLGLEVVQDSGERHLGFGRGLAVLSRLAGRGRAGQLLLLLLLLGVSLLLVGMPGLVLGLHLGRTQDVRKEASEGVAVVASRCRGEELDLSRTGWQEGADGELQSGERGRSSETEARERRPQHQQHTSTQLAQRQSPRSRMSSGGLQGIKIDKYAS